MDDKMFIVSTEGRRVVRKHLKGKRDHRFKSVFTVKIYEVIEGRVIPEWKKFW
jgi:hypothetical protein